MFCTWGAALPSLVLVPPGPLFGFHLRLRGLILCRLRIWNETHTGVKTDGGSSEQTNNGGGEEENQSLEEAENNKDRNNSRSRTR